MLLKNWDKLPQNFKCEEVRVYYDILKRKTFSLALKRIFDIVVAICFISLFSPVYIVLAILIVIDSGFPFIYKQTRITQNGKEFKVFKFRTMVKDADKIGTLVTVDNDSRITKIGSFLRKYRLDELPQAFNVLLGSMTFVGTRPEVKKYVDEYTPEMYATLLLPAGITSTASIEFKDESVMLENAQDADKEYIENILPIKMKHNLDYIKKFSFLRDVLVVLKTVVAVIK